MLGATFVHLTGTLAKDPEMRYTPAGKALLELTVAGSDVAEINGDLKALAFYHRVTFWSGQAEFLADRIHQGDAVSIRGVLKQDRWQTQDGQNRSAVNITGRQIMYLGTPGSDAVDIDAKGQPRLRGAVNEVAIVGNLTRDAELRYTPSGRAVANLGIAVNERIPRQGRDAEERAHFFNITAWNDLAEGIAELPKGAPADVLGRLANDSWTDRDGNKRFGTSVTATRIVGGAAFRSEGGADTPTQPRGGSQQQRAPQREPNTRRLDIDEEFPPEEDLPF